MARTAFCYDVILYGLGIKSLTIGSRLARRGKKVFLLAIEEDAED